MPDIRKALPLKSTVALNLRETLQCSGANPSSGAYINDSRHVFMEDRLMTARTIALTAILVLAPFAASASIFNMDQARTFCAAGNAEKADRCLADQQSAGAWLDAWSDVGEFPRFMAKRIVSRCDTRYRPDMRQVKFCVEKVRDNRGKSSIRTR